MERYLGIYRERSHSPGRVDDDTAILDSTAARLRAAGSVVELVDADQAAVALTRGWAGVFVMCEGDALLARLQRLADAGTPVVNSPAAIRATYRRLTVEAFRRARVAAPESWVVTTRSAGPPPAAAVWVKRSDFHATEADDVLFADSDAAWRDALARFAARGQDSVVVQTHVAGDLVKFYGVPGSAGQGDWFHWFYHRDQQLAGYSFDVAPLRQAALHAADALGVEVFGGDAIIDADGRAWVIDLNAWPSFARCREAAATAIAARLRRRFITTATDGRLSSAA